MKLKIFFYRRAHYSSRYGNRYIFFILFLLTSEIENRKIDYMKFKMYHTDTRIIPLDMKLVHFCLFISSHLLNKENGKIY